MALNLAELTKEQLQAMGLDDAQIAAILNTVEENKGGQGVPFPLLKINFDPDFGKVGAYAYNPQRDDEGNMSGYEYISEEVTIRPIKSLYQYSKFDVEQNKPTVTSNIFPLREAKKAYDLKTGTPISVLKEADNDIKFQRILLGTIEIDGEEKPFVMYAKGSFLYELNNILGQYKNDGHMTHKFTLGTKKNKKGTVIWYTPTFVDVKELSQDEFIKKIKEDAELIRQFDEWVVSVNAGNSDTPSTTKSTPDVEVDESEINF